jgi:hypothetical protein
MTKLTDPNDPIYTQNPGWLRPGESTDQWKIRTGHKETTPQTTTPTTGQTVGQTITPVQSTSQYTGSSIVDYLKGAGQASDFASRSKLAQQYGIANYGGTAEQNTQLLNLLRGQAGSVPPASKDPEDIAQGLDATGGDQTKVAGTSEAERAKIRQAEIERIKKELEPSIEKPTTYKSVEDYERLRKEKGIVDDENELTAVQNEANLIKQELRQYSATAGEGVSEGGRIGKMSEAERNANFRLEGLMIKEQAVLSRINSKNAYISNMLNLGQQDYVNALNEYNTEYNRNLKAVELYNAEQNELEQNAIASLSTITSLMTEKGILYDSLDQNTKTQIDTLSLQAGLPQGLIQQALEISPGDKIQTVAQRTDASGNEYFDILKVKPDGSLYVEKVYRGVAEGTGPSGNKYIDPNTNEPMTSYEAARSIINHPDNADASDESLYLAIKENVPDLSVTEINKLISTREKKELTIENIKQKIVDTLSDQKDTYSRSEAKKLAESQLKSAIGIKATETLPKAYTNAIEDALVEVYGRTFWQKVLPGGR